MDVVFISRIFFFHCGPLNLILKYEKDPISGCRYIPHSMLWDRLPLDVVFISRNFYFQCSPLKLSLQFEKDPISSWDIPLLIYQDRLPKEVVFISSILYFQCSPICLSLNFLYRYIYQFFNYNPFAWRLGGQVSFQYNTFGHPTGWVFPLCRVWQYSKINSRFRHWRWSTTMGLMARWRAKILFSSLFFLFDFSFSLLDCLEVNDLCFLCLLGPPHIQKLRNVIQACSLITDF